MDFFLSLQLLLVLTSHWDANSGTLYQFERASSTSEWQMVAQPIEVSVGKNGMAWGRGFHSLTSLLGPVKQEGDKRSPAGIFPLGTAFGDPLHRNFAQKIPYLLIEKSLECIDDSTSRYYNQFIQSQEIQGTRDWQSSERMQDYRDEYALGVYIGHNTSPPVAGCGSCIFFHIWKTPHQGTAGCTAMAERDLCAVVSWLDCQKNPCLVQLPLEEFYRKQQTWQLPLHLLRKVSE